MPDFQIARKSQFIPFSLVLGGLDITELCRHVKSRLKAIRYAFAREEGLNGYVRQFGSSRIDYFTPASLRRISVNDTV